jgi:hypothetical protein
MVKTKIKRKGVKADGCHSLAAPTPTSTECPHLKGEVISMLPQNNIDVTNAALVKLTRPARTEQGIIFPQGHTGKVLEVNTYINCLMVDFGIRNYCYRVPFGSDLIEIIRVNDEVS